MPLPLPRSSKAHGPLPVAFSARAVSASRRRHIAVVACSPVPKAIAAGMHSAGLAGVRRTAEPGSSSSRPVIHKRPPMRNGASRRGGGSAVANSLSRHRRAPVRRTVRAKSARFGFLRLAINFQPRVATG